METALITDADRAKAQRCLECPVCHRVREKQRGLGYEKVYGRKAHEALPAAEA